MKGKLPTRRVTISFMASLLVSSATVAFLSCSDDDLVGQPSWLGNSIYERLQDDGNYTYTLRLIDDLGQTDVLSSTGSKTLFVADDAAYDAFFAGGGWGVHSYDALSTAQKKLLLNSAMINNAYLVELLSNVSGNPPLEGQCMRRESAISVYDSVSRIFPDEMPQTSYWDKYRNDSRGLVLLRDNTAPPMIHFLPLYMQTNKITDSDLSILTNGESTSISDAWVNGKKIIERDISCKNGYIHKVEGVMTSSDNMAEIIHKHANMKTFAGLMDRFSAPYRDDAATTEYDRLYNTSDTVYTLKYFSEQGSEYTIGDASGSMSTDNEGEAVDATLTFDPEWNQYMYTNTADRDLHYDAGAMLVPTNEALDSWWNADGKVLQDMYGAWENVPMKVLVKLININMINSFSETVPSKFDNIVDNTTKVSLGLTTSDVDSCFMGCNGVVYLINKVFSPADYSSVSFPALVNENTMSVIYWAIDNLNFEPYLNSMDSYYSFIIPTNNAMLTYVDPCSYGNSTTVMFQFYYDTATKTVKAHRYYYDIATKTVNISSMLDDASDDQISNRLTDLLNSLIIVGDVEDGHTYYKTKGGSIIKVENAGTEGKMKIYGGLQEENDQPLTVSTIYDMTLTGNGKSYVVDEQMPLSSTKSLYAILKEHDEYTEFYKLLEGSDLLTTKLSGRYTCTDYNVKLFDAYNYTVYIPTNDVIKQLHSDGYLPDWGDYEDLTSEQFGGNSTALKQARTLVQDRINNFIRYHIQDNSVYIGGSGDTNVKYETAKINPANNRFFSLTVNSDQSALTVEDQLGNKRSVVTTSGLYNNTGREYWVQNAGKSSDQLYNASDLVVHQIDGALFYDDDQLTKWKDEVDSISY